MKSRVASGRASAQQLRRACVDSDCDDMLVANFADEALAHRVVFRSSAEAPRVPIAGKYAVSRFNGKLQADFLLLDDLIAWRAMGVFSKYSLLKFGLRFAVIG